MKRDQAKLLGIGAVLAFICVALGAFGAHALNDILAGAGLRQYNLGIHYAFIHALAILAAGLAMPVAARPRSLVGAAGCFMLGIVLFSGSLIMLALSGWHEFALLTPLGGLSFLFGWGLFAYAMKQLRSRDR